MSGGRFDYLQHKIHEAACEIDKLISSARNQTPDENGYVPEFSPFSGEALEKVRCFLIDASAALQAADYMLCGDIGEDEFLSRIRSLDNPDGIDRAYFEDSTCD